MSSLPALIEATNRYRKAKAEAEIDGLTAMGVNLGKEKPYAMRGWKVMQDAPWDWTILVMGLSGMAKHRFYVCLAYRCREEENTGAPFYDVTGTHLTECFGDSNPPLFWREAHELPGLA